MKKVLVIGGPGNGTVVGESIIDANRLGSYEYKFEGFVNDVEKTEKIDGYPIFGGLNDIGKLIDQDYHFVYSIYKFDDQKHRIELFKNLEIPLNRLIRFVHPTAFVSPSVKMSPGVCILPNVSITANTQIGLNCIIRPGTTIGHDNKIGDHVSITAGASIGSCIDIKQGASIGLKACIREYLTLEEYSMVGMGAVLTKNLPYGELWVGNPAKFLRKAKWLSNE